MVEIVVLKIELLKCCEVDELLECDMVV